MKGMQKGWLRQQQVSSAERPATHDQRAAWLRQQHASRVSRPVMGDLELQPGSSSRASVALA